MNRPTGRLGLFADRVLGGAPLDGLLAEMRELRDAGLTSVEVVGLLEDMRALCPDTDREDTILELMDYATGFCPIDQAVWFDRSPSGLDPRAR